MGLRRYSPSPPSLMSCSTRGELGEGQMYLRKMVGMWPYWFFLMVGVNSPGLKSQMSRNWKVGLVEGGMLGVIIL